MTFDGPRSLSHPNIERPSSSGDAASSEAIKVSSEGASGHPFKPARLVAKTFERLQSSRPSLEFAMADFRTRIVSS
jgi:hypothetical protein